MRGWKRYGLVVLGALVFQACGGDAAPEGCPPGTTGTAPTCVAIPPPCTQTTIYNEAEPMPPQTLVYFDFSVPDTGRLDITLDWTFARSPVGFYLVPANTCTLEEFNARSCNFLIRSEPPATKPRKLSQASFAAGNYRWLTGTFGEENESGSLLIVLSKGTSCPALTSAAVDASADDEGDRARMQRAIRR
jgi:hypothetical protein